MWHIRLTLSFGIVDGREEDPTVKKVGDSADGVYQYAIDGYLKGDLCHVAE